MENIENFDGRLCLKPKEAAERLGLSLPIVYRLCDRDDFPAIRCGRAILIPVPGLVRWLDQQAGGFSE